MERILIFICILSYTLCTGQQNKDSIKNSGIIKCPAVPPQPKTATSVYYSSEVNSPAVFMLDTLSFEKYVTAKYNRSALPPGAKRIFCSFVIETDGSLSTIEVKRAPSYAAGQEAIRIIKQSPRWKPALLNNMPVRMGYVLILDFYHEK